MRAFAALLLTVLFVGTMIFFPLKTHADGKSAPGKGGKGRPDKPDAAADAAPAGDAASPPAPTSASGRPTPPAAPENPAPAPASPGTVAATIPTGSGLPVIVGVAFYFLDLKSFDDNKGEFSCTTDVRYRWTDLRLAYPAAEAFHGYKEWRGKAAEEKLATMWTPNIEIVNRLESSGYVGHRLRIFPNGKVETITRQTASYKAEVHPERFPFDRQNLVIDALVREETSDEVVLAYDNDDVEFSRVSRKATLEGWDPGLVELDDDIVPGWNGDRYSRVTASLFVDRLPSMGFAPVFIPLVASLLIPLLAIWMNKATEDGFEIEAFELANVGIGGLFSVIALSFAIYSSYSAISAGDNTVTRLFGLNYATLALALSIVVALFQFNLAHRWFGPYVHQQLFKWIAWALPVLTLGTSLAFLLVAAA